MNSTFIFCPAHCIQKTLHPNDGFRKHLIFTHVKNMSFYMFLIQFFFFREPLGLPSEMLNCNPDKKQRQWKVRHLVIQRRNKILSVNPKKLLRIWLCSPPSKTTSCPVFNLVIREVSYLSFLSFGNTLFLSILFDTSLSFNLYHFWLDWYKPCLYPSSIWGRALHRILAKYFPVCLSVCVSIPFFIFLL